MKKQEVPTALHGFYDIFRKLEFRHNYITLFDDFLSAMMNFFIPPGVNGFSIDRFNKYTKEERLVFGELINAIILIFDQQISEHTKWYDPFGDFYQLLASRGKQSLLGQFFTPVHVVDLMVKMQNSGQQLTGKKLRVSDPTCGSGRMLIAYHTNFPGNYCYGEDLDEMCCKMTCLNMMIHGCEGEVIHHNSLLPDSYIQGWRINHQIRSHGFPNILPITKEQSLVWQTAQQKLIHRQAEQIRMEGERAQDTIKKNGLQLKFF